MLKNSLCRFFSLQTAICLGVCLALFFSQSVQAQTFQQTSPTPIIPPFLPNLIALLAPQVPRAFFPMISNRSGAGIFGLVTQDGQPAGNVTLNLRKIDGSSTVVAGTAITDSNGYYQFINAASLGAGQAYQVVYDYSYAANNSAGRLASWITKLISSYLSGQNVNIGNFDIADVVLTGPALDASQALPVTFSWVLRIHSTTDSYRLRIMDYSNPPPIYTEQYASSYLGYIDHFDFQSSDWPAGMVYSSINSPHVYFWYVMIQAPDTGSGSTSLMWRLKFLPSP